LCIFIVMKNLTEQVQRIRKMMGINPKPINISYHEHLLDTFSDGDSEISEDNESGEKDVVSKKINNNEFTNDPESFLRSLQKSSRKEMLTDYTVEDLENMKTYKLDGYDIGYALKQDDEGNYNEIVSVFNNSGIKGLGDDLIQSALRNGGRYLDHYDGFLSGFYSKHGFEEYKRDKFDPQYDPTGEFRDKYGEADIIYRRYNDE
jgi:hypothetical protein